MTTKTFHIGDILSCTTSRLVSPRHMNGVQELLEFMAGEPVWTHQLPRVSRESEPALREQFPDLAAVEPPEEFRDKEHVESWLAELVAKHGETRDVRPLAADQHTSIDPMTELAVKMGQNRGIAITLPDAAHQGCICGPDQSGEGPDERPDCPAHGIIPQREWPGPKLAAVEDPF